LPAQPKNYNKFVNIAFLNPGISYIYNKEEAAAINGLQLPLCYEITEWDENFTLL